MTAANPQRVKEYLTRHGIGALFEEMMGKIIVDMPNDPMRYLQTVLQTKIDLKQGDRTGFSRSATSPVRSRPPNPEAVRKTMPVQASPEVLRKTAISSSADWTQDIQSKDRSYERPWQSNSKRLKPKKADGELEPKIANTTRAKQDTEGQTKIRRSGFEDLWEDSVGGQKTLDKPLAATMPLISSTTPLISSISNQQSTEVMNNWRKVSVIHNVMNVLRSEKDLLADEVPSSMRMSRSSEEPIIDKATLTVSSGKQKGLRSDQAKVDKAKHMSEIKLKVVKYLIDSSDSGFNEDRDFEYDDAAELYEELDDLRREGVTKGCGSNPARQTVRRAPVAPALCELKVGICARCANIIEGGIPSDSFKVVDSRRHVPEAFVDDFPSVSHPPSARTIPSVRDYDSYEDDDDFESVSQVNGPRRPVWNDSDNEVPQTANQRVSASTNSLPMPRSIDPSLNDQAKKTSGRPSSAVGLTSTKSRPIPVDSGDHLISDDDRRSSTSRHGLSGSGWHVPDGDDTDDSTAYVTGEEPKNKKPSKPRVY